MAAPAPNCRISRRETFIAALRICARWSKPARTEHLDAELLLHGAAETVFHLRAFIVRRRRALVFGLGLDAEPDEVGPGRGDDLGHFAVEFVQPVDGDGALEPGAARHHG